MLKKTIVKLYQTAARVSNAIRSAGGIWFRPYPYSRRQLFVTYVRLLLTARHEPATKCVDILGYSLEYQNRSQLIRLFTEIFIDEAYYFDPKKPDPVVIDCGSNIGVSVLYFKTICSEARIQAFEPHRETFEILQRNIIKNNVKNVFLHNVALAGHDGEALLYSHPQRPLNMTLKEDYGNVDKTSSRTVRLRRLSEYILKPVDLIKIDVEGSEEDVIEELIQSGKLKLVRQLIVEHHAWFLKTTSETFQARIEKEGFNLVRMSTNTNSNESIMSYVRGEEM